MERQCLKENEIAKITTLMERMIKEFYGNGQEGLSKSIPKLQNQIATLIETTAAQGKAISGLAKAVTEITSIEEYKEKHAGATWERAGILISAILGVSGVAISIILKI
jgi:hypothetical protein